MQQSLASLYDASSSDDEVDEKKLYFSHFSVETLENIPLRIMDYKKLL